MVAHTIFFGMSSDSEGEIATKKRRNNVYESDNGSEVSEEEEDEDNEEDDDRVFRKHGKRGDVRVCPMDFRKHNRRYGGVLDKLHFPLFNKYF